MLHLGLAVSVFILTHLVPSIPGVRDGLIVRLGKASYIFLYSLVSLATLVWVIWAALMAQSCSCGARRAGRRGSR